MNSLTIHPVISLPFVLAIVVVLLALLWVGPRYRILPWRQKGLLVALRLLVVLLVLFAMLRPTLVITKLEPQQASLVLLADSSRSMQVEDSIGNTSRWNSMKRLLGEAAEDLAKLSKTWDVHVYRFDSKIQELPLEEGRLELPEVPEGEQTALGAAMEEVMDQTEGDRVLAMLLLSDGAQRAVAPHDLPPQAAARRLAAENIPLYTFTFGKSGGRQRADLSIDDLVTNETIFAETPTEIRGLLQAHGYANQQVKVQLLWESTPKEGDRKMEVVDTIQLDTGNRGADEEAPPIPILLRHTPSQPGEYKVTLRVEPREGELVTSNNEASTFVTVRQGGMNVLFLVGAKRIGGGPGPEQRFVRAALAQSPDIVVERRLLNYHPPKINLQEMLQENQWDVVLLDDVDVQALNRASWKMLADRVREGLGLMMIGGYHSFGPGGFRHSPLEDILPIRIGAAQRQNFGEPVREDMQLAGPIRMLPAEPRGKSHPIMQLGHNEAAQSLWSELPPLDGANRFDRRKLKPNAIVLAEADDRMKHPLLIAAQSGHGRVLAFAGDSTWRWPMYGFGEAHRRFWRQAILWLAKKDEQTEGRVWIRLGSRRVVRGSRVDFSVGAENAQHESVRSAQFEIKVHTPNGEVIDLRSTKTSSHVGAVFRNTQTPGDYRIEVTAREKGTELGTATARFLVPRHDIELDRPAAEPSLLAQLAKMTEPAGGAALAPEELPGLLKKLADKPPEWKEEILTKITYWDTWPFFLLFVSLLGVEWYLRKKWGLV